MRLLRPFPTLFVVESELTYPPPQDNGHKVSMAVCFSPVKVFSFDKSPIEAKSCFSKEV